MVEQQRQRVEQEMTKLVDDIDKQFLRKMQVKVPNIIFTATAIQIFAV